jgi:hypothetical protein
VAVGGGAWLCQSWRDVIQAFSTENARYDDLSLEAAGRTVFRDRFWEAFLSPAITRHLLPNTDCSD